MKILLTGASGFIGSHARDHLSKEHNVVAVSHRPISGCPDSVELDLTAPDRFGVLPTDVDAIVHLAQSHHHREFPVQARDILDVNVNATFHLAEWGRRIGIQRFIYSSSANVYAPSAEPLVETSLLGPDSFYGATKYAAEVLLTPYSKFFKVDILRLFTVFGPGQSNGLLPQIFERLMLGKFISLQGERGFTLSPIHVDDVAEALRRVLRAPYEDRPTKLNLCGSQEISVKEIAETLADLLNVRPKFERGKDAGRNFIGDNSLFGIAYGWEPGTSIRQSLSNYLAWRRLDPAE